MSNLTNKLKQYFEKMASRNPESGMYAPNVPRVSVITPSGSIDTDLLEQVMRAQR